jgi:hypothetical protein
VHLQGSLNQTATCLGELDDPAATVSRVGCSTEQFLGLQMIGRGGYRATRKEYLLPDGF